MYEVCPSHAGGAHHSSEREQRLSEQQWSERQSSERQSSERQSSEQQSSEQQLSEPVASCPLQWSSAVSETVSEFDSPSSTIERPFLETTDGSMATDCSEITCGDETVRTEGYEPLVDMRDVSADVSAHEKAGSTMACKVFSAEHQAKFRLDFREELQVWKYIQSRRPTSSPRLMHRVMLKPRYSILLPNESVSLRKLVRQAGMLPPCTVSYLVSRVLRALCELHDMSVVHGSLSSDAIMVTSDGRILIRPVRCTRLTGAPLSGALPSCPGGGRHRHSLSRVGHSPLEYSPLEDSPLEDSPLEESPLENSTAFEESTLVDPCRTFARDCEDLPLPLAYGHSPSRTHAGDEVIRGNGLSRVSELRQSRSWDGVVTVVAYRERSNSAGLPRPSVGGLTSQVGSEASGGPGSPLGSQVSTVVGSQVSSTLSEIDSEMSPSVTWSPSVRYSPSVTGSRLPAVSLCRTGRFAMPAAGLNYYGCITAIPPECICGGNIEELVEEQLSRGVLDIEGLREAVAAQPVTWYRPCAAFDVWALGVLTVELVLGWTPLQLVNLFGVDNAPLMPLGDQIRYVTSPAFWTALLKQLLAEQLVDSDCADFIALCTALSPVVRPTTSALMNHPFITKEKRSTTRQSPGTRRLSRQGTTVGHPGGASTIGGITTGGGDGGGGQNMTRGELLRQVIRKRRPNGGIEKVLSLMQRILRAHLATAVARAPVAGTAAAAGAEGSGRGSRRRGSIVNFLSPALAHFSALDPRTVLKKAFEASSGRGMAGMRQGVAIGQGRGGKEGAGMDPSGGWLAPNFRE